MLPVLPLRPQRSQHLVWMTSNVSFTSSVIWFCRPGTELAFSQHKRMLTKWVNSSGKNIYISFNHISHECNFVLSQFSYVLHEFNFLKMISMCAIVWRGRNSKELSSSLGRGRVRLLMPRALHVFSADTADCLTWNLLNIGRIVSFFPVFWQAIWKPFLPILVSNLLYMCPFLPLPPSSVSSEQVVCQADCWHEFKKLVLFFMWIF